jgi:hypothetical protein
MKLVFIDVMTASLRLESRATRVIGMIPPGEGVPRVYDQVGGILAVKRAARYVVVPVPSALAGSVTIGATWGKVPVLIRGITQLRIFARLVGSE